MKRNFIRVAIAAAVVLVAVILLGTYGKLPAFMANKLALADASEVLDLTSELPDNFRRMSAEKKAEIGNIDPGSDFKDIETFCALLPLVGQEPYKEYGINSQFSDVEVFRSLAPYQFIFAYYTIAEDPADKAAIEALMANEEQLKVISWEGTKNVACGDITGNISQGVEHPDIGEKAVLAYGRGTSYVAAWVGYDLVIFRHGDAYIFVASGHIPGTEVPLMPLVEAIEQRVAKFAP